MTYVARLPDLDDARRSRILSAAERAFARHGFHGASMQHVAAEAEMSAGNLYRTFPSKDAIVSGLAERDRAEMTCDFQALGTVRDLLPTLGGLLRKHLVDEPAWRTQLVLEIWAEASRNPTMAGMCAAMERDVDAHLSQLVESAKASTPAYGRCEPGVVVRVMETVVAGLFKRRATQPAFDADSEIALALGIFKSALEGSIQPYSPDTVNP